MSRTIAILLSATLGLGATAANAHPRLQSSNPAPGALLKSAPKDIRMSFSEELVPNFTGLELKTSGGKSIPTGKATLAVGNNKIIVVPIGTRLSPGTYGVAWHAVSVDTHRVTGSYSFKVMR
jgi:methionine-rich copper-binding protein CopC